MDDRPTCESWVSGLVYRTRKSVPYQLGWWQPQMDGRAFHSIFHKRSEPTAKNLSIPAPRAVAVLLLLSPGCVGEDVRAVYDRSLQSHDDVAIQPPVRVCSVRSSSREPEYFTAVCGTA